MKNSIFFLLLLITFLKTVNANCQTYVSWSPVYNTTALTGTFPGGNVVVTETGAGNNIEIYSPSLYGGNVIVQNAFTFSTFGPNSSTPSKRLTFTFSTPVIVTRYNMSDIDTGNGWNDTFNFIGIVFTNTTSSNCTATTTGATATTDVGDNSEIASWFTSTTPITSFSLNYIGNLGNFTHAYLAYSLQVALPTASNPTVTVNSPTICSNSTTNTTTIIATPAQAGTYNYAWTVPSGVLPPGNVASFTTSTIGNYSVIITNTTTNLSSNSVTGVVSSLSPILPLFTQVSQICEGNTQLPLPTTSTNSISGSWSPTINNTQTTTYTFTPSAGICANNTQMTIVVNPKVNPLFTQVAQICEGNTLLPLPTTSINSISGTWSPTINNTQTTTYTFTPSTGICANSAQMTIIVIPKVNPIFNSVSPLCYGTNFSLPTISLNGILGNWSPALNNIVTTIYTFTPNSGECANQATMMVTVFNDFDFEISQECINNDFILTSSALNNSFNESLVDYNWEYNNLNIGNNSNTLNLTSYVNSTSTVEQLPITIKIIITNSDGCPKEKNYIVDNMYCDIQKGISPNGDGDNEFFDLRLLNVQKLSIYNRYGVKVYSKNNYYDQWRGETDNGKILPDGTYYYLIEFKNNSNPKTGWIYVIR